MQLADSVNTLAKITKPQIAALKKLEIETVRDLLLFFPYKYLDFSQVKLIKDIKPGENISLKVKLNSIGSRFAFRARLSLAEALVSDETGSLKITWFNQAYLAKTLQPGEELFLAGEVENYKGKLQLINPIYEQVSDLAYRQAGFPKHTARLVPVYHQTSGLYQKSLRNLIAQILPLAKDLQDILPSEIKAGQNLLSLEQTVNFSHFPESLAQVEDARKRLAFEEIFLNQLAAQKHKKELEKKKSYKIPFNQSLAKEFVSSLPFELTAHQKKAAWDILQDLEKPYPMNRLLEGDVGSGKTLVALMAALQCANQELQVALLAPTEILALQHYQTVQNLHAKRYTLHTCLLTSSTSKFNGEAINKLKLSSLIQEGMPGLYIGTHALLQKTIKFKKLALVIIDEQHRYGVEQRARLINSYKKTPHLLSLSATPIPRTLQLAFFGDLEVSQITQKPVGRKPIVTKVVTQDNRSKAYEYIRKQIQNGRQAFIITPRIEESETAEIKSAISEHLALQKIFSEYKVGLLHGRLKSSEKEAAMKAFLNNETQILVSTSVVEVGVDVPNASVMLIEGAERFGLAQLHQFRGRVGRSEHQSYCFLFQSKEAPSSMGEGQGEGAVEARSRLEAFAKTQDGFALAELDLKLRGFGDIYGSEQSGINFKYFDLKYTSLIPLAREEAKKLVDKDPELKEYPLLLEKISQKTVHFE
jgi:ATP-dependent DNA helicase RecG